MRINKLNIVFIYVVVTFTFTFPFPLTVTSLPSLRTTRLTVYRGLLRKTWDREMSQYLELNDGQRMPTVGLGTYQETTKVCYRRVVVLNSLRLIVLLLQWSADATRQVARGYRRYLMSRHLHSPFNCRIDARVSLNSNLRLYRLANTTDDSKERKQQTPCFSKLTVMFNKLLSRPIHCTIYVTIHFLLTLPQAAVLRNAVVCPSFCLRPLRVRESMTEGHCMS